MGNQLFVILKFGQEEHINNLVEQGEIYLNTIDFFRKSEREEVGDKYEGASLIVNMENFTIKAENPDFERPFVFHGITGQLTNYSTDFTHCYSVYAMSNRLFENSDKHKVDERMAKFGTHCVLIENPHDFIGRVLEELKKHTGTYAWNFVNYHDFSVLGEHKPSHFDKTKDLSHHAEYRILAKLEVTEPVKLYIRSIKEYCKIWEATTMLETEWTAKRV